MSLDAAPIQIEGFGDTPTTASEFTIDNQYICTCICTGYVLYFLPAPVTNMQE